MSISKPNLPSSWGSAALHVQGTNIFGAAEAEPISAQGINCGLFYSWHILALFPLDQTFDRVPFESQRRIWTCSASYYFYVEGAFPLTAAWGACVVPAVGPW